jgi:hypothetical protein
VMLAGALEPGDDIADVGLRPDILADPAGRAPLQGVQLDGRIALDGGAGDLPFVADVAVDLAGRGLDAGLGAVGAVGAGTDLQLEHLQRCAVAGAEQVVVDLVADRGGIVGEEPGVAATSDNGADSVEHA